MDSGLSATGFSLLEWSERLGERRKSIPIVECHEALVSIPSEHFSCESPHPYMAEGAPYGECNPFFVREGVLARLYHAQALLDGRSPGWRLHVFDGYRPIAVQAYMVDVERKRVATRMGLNHDCLSHEDEDVVMQSVFSLWSRPSRDPKAPPPHATGGAIDVSLVDASGTTVEMGSAFDELSPRSYPDHYLHDMSDFGRTAHAHRLLLKDVMESVGFKRLSHEWWHFSYGDQMWSLLSYVQGGEQGEPVPACYGAV